MLLSFVSLMLITSMVQDPGCPVTVFCHCEAVLVPKVDYHQHIEDHLVIWPKQMDIRENK